MAPLKKSGAIWLIVTKTSVSSNTFIDDLVKLSQIKQELQSSFLLNNFL